MTEFCFPNPINNSNNIEKNRSKSSVFTNLCSLILSHKLYFSYLIFFSPYLFKLLYFLSPLFFTIFLLLLSLTTTLIPLNSIINSKDGFFISNTFYTTLSENFCPDFDNDFELETLLEMQEFEVYKFVFDVPTIELTEANPVEHEQFGGNPVEFFCQEEEITVDQCESLIVEQETGDTNPKKIKEQKEKKWRGTLACLLFEERHNWSNNKINLNGSEEEGMDLLWETHETEINRGNLKEENKEKLRRRKYKIKDLMQNDDQSEDSDDYYDNGKICCLQALKLSAGKMNLSMGSPNLVKFSKAIKGIGWLKSHVKRQGKKGYK